jgi:hypothetical protein
MAGGEGPSPLEAGQPQGDIGKSSAHGLIPAPPGEPPAPGATRSPSGAYPRSCHPRVNVANFTQLEIQLSKTVAAQVWRANFLRASVSTLRERGLPEAQGPAMKARLKRPNIAMHCNVHRFAHSRPALRCADSAQIPTVIVFAALAGVGGLRATPLSGQTGGEGVRIN